MGQLTPSKKKDKKKRTELLMSERKNSLSLSLFSYVLPHSLSSFKFDWERRTLPIPDKFGWCGERESAQIMKFFLYNLPMAIQN